MSETNDEGLGPSHCYRFGDRFVSLTENQWLQIEQAASGCIDGTSDEWPVLRHAISLITGKPFTYRKTASWMQGFCEAVVSMDQPPR